MSDQGNDAVDLVQVQHRLDELEDRLAVEHPLPDTPNGGAQRARIEVPTPRSIMTIGARGLLASDGPALGPGGFNLLTDESFGAEIHGSTCIDTDGLTILHSVGTARVLTAADLGIASNAMMRLGTTEGDIELTAGEVEVPDPEFTVQPSILVPTPAEIETGEPREPTEETAEGIEHVWQAIEALEGVSAWASFMSKFSLSSGLAAGSVLSRVAGAIGLVRAAWNVGAAAAAAAAAAAVPFDAIGLFESSSEAPRVKIHGAGGVNLTSPAGVSASAPKISLAASWTAGIQAATKVSVKSPGNVSVFGGAAATVASMGPAVLKSDGSAATVVGKFVQLDAEEIAKLGAEKHVMVAGHEKVSIESHGTIVVAGGEYVGLSSGDMVQAEAPTVHTTAREQNTVSSAQKVLIKGDQEIDLESGGAKMTVKDGEFRLDPGGGFALVLDRSSFQLPRSGFRVEAGHTRIRGNVDLG